MNRSEDIPIFIPKSRAAAPVRGSYFFAYEAQAGLLTFGSSGLLRLPIFSDSGIMQQPSPITAAGPSPILTGFPIKR